MTHTLHRKGSVEDLRKDFIVFSMASQTVNAKGCVPKLRRIFEIIEKYKPVNFGDVKTGNMFKVSAGEIKNNLRENSYIHFVFTDRETVKQVLEELKKEDIGLSVVVTGVIEDINQILNEIGLRMHTVEYSGGIYGNTKLLPEEPVLEITTMCGHGLISAGLVKYLVSKVKQGNLSVREAAVELARQCQCGIFNPVRAEKIVERLAGLRE